MRTLLESIKMDDAVVEIHVDETFSLDDVEFEQDRKLFENGTLESFVAVVKVFDRSGHVEGSDVLGGIWCRNRDDFLSAVKENGMIENARADLKRNLEAVRVANFS